MSNNFFLLAALAAVITLFVDDRLFLLFGTLSITFVGLGLFNQREEEHNI